MDGVRASVARSAQWTELELLVLAAGTDVHDDAVALVAHAVLRVGGAVQFVVDHGQRPVVLEDDLAEAQRVAVPVGAGVGGRDADDL